MSASKPKTRKILSCPIFGHPREINKTVLPSCGDVMRQYLFSRNDLKPSDASTKDPTTSILAVSEVVAKCIEGQWTRASIPIISHKRVLEKIRLYHEKYRTLLKPYKQRKENANYNLKLHRFEHDPTSPLFDIAACKCRDFFTCNCPKH